MCEFCKLDEYGDGKEITRKIMTEPIGVGNLEDILRLEAWILSGDTGDDEKIQLSLTISDTGDDLAYLNIPINYCPKCGRKLK